MQATEPPSSRAAQATLELERCYAFQLVRLAGEPCPLLSKDINSMTSAELKTCIDVLTHTLRTKAK